MTQALRHYISSDYLDAAQRLSPKKKRRRIIAYVESYDDVAFWRNILKTYENEDRYFEVMLPSSETLTRGKKTVLLSTLNDKQFGRNLIACVDSDYDFLLQNRTDISRKLNTNPYIFQTYAYAIENFQCYAESLHNVCVEATLNDHKIFDFPAFLRQYSEIIYPLFLWNVWYHSRRDLKTFPMHEFNGCITLQGIDISHPEHSLNYVRLRVEKKLSHFRKVHSMYLQEVQDLGKELEQLGLTPQTTYLYIQGHHLVKNVVMKVLIPVCTTLRREREEEIRRQAVHRQQYNNELAGYEHSSVAVELMLRKNTNYTDLYLYKWIHEDIQHFIDTDK